MGWRNGVKSIPSVGGILGALISTGTSACAGGVCVVSAQAAGTGLVASSMFGGLGVYSGLSSYYYSPAVHAVHMSLWVKIAVVLLLLTSSYNVYKLSGFRLAATVAAISGIIAASA